MEPGEFLTEDLARRLMEEYWEELRRKASEALRVAKLARAKGLDPELVPETTFTESVADRVEKFVGPKGIARVIKEMEEKGMEREEIAIELAIRIAKGELTSETDPEKLADQALRTSLALLTESVTAAPLEGIAKVKIKENQDGSPYLAVYYAGPIRSAGGTEAALTVVLADIIRQVLGLDRFKPSERHVKRYIEERDLYGRVANYQTPAKPDQIAKAVELCPIEITGEATDDIEVKGTRDVYGVETNKLRGGAMLIINDGLVGRAKKLLKKVEKIRDKYGDRFDFSRVYELVESLYGKEEEIEEEEKEEIDLMRVLEDDDLYYKLVEKHKEIPTKEDHPHYFKYLDDMVLGRPVFSYPGRPGGFRLRYGRSRVTGFAAVGIHPATMAILDDFLVPGTQIKMQGPGKGAVVMPVDSIEGPIVLLKDGTVKRLNSYEEAVAVREEVEKILFLGDMLIAIGEFIENKTPLRFPGYNEERRYEEAKRKVPNPPKDFDSAYEAVEFSKRYNVPLHPKYTHFRRLISVDDLRYLRRRINFSDGSYDERVKRILETIGAQHHIEEDRIVIDDEVIYLLLSNKDVDRKKYEGETCTLKVLKEISGVRIRDKAGTFIGARMGRPEKAKLRKMAHPFHVLYPVSDKSKNREIGELASGKVTVDLATFKCPRCGRITHTYFCPRCLAEEGVIVRTEPICVKGEVEEGARKANVVECDKAKPYTKFRLTEDVIKNYKRIAERMRIERDGKIKGVRGLMNARREPEFVLKGILRKKHEIYEFKDATVRFDSTNVPITHFRPREIHVSVEKLRELGYKYDIYGNELVSEDQIVELKPQDVILPREALEAMRRVSKFIDELLVKVYGLDPFYNAKRPEDLIGHLVVGLSPHTSAGIVGRIIGRVNTHTGLAHPYRHAAKRRNADGDEDAVILLLDALINFSRHFLPEKRGGQMDAPLVIQLILDPQEVDDEVHNMDVHRRIPLEVYAAAVLGLDPGEVEDHIEIVEKRLGTPFAYVGLGFTHDTSGFDYGVYVNRYSSGGEMIEKFFAQRRLEEKIVAVDTKDTAKRVLEKHVIPDILGNFRSYMRQKFMCGSCNKTYRRPLISGKCPECGRPLRPTLSYNSVVKYFGILLYLRNHIDDEYLLTRIDVIIRTLKDTFGKVDVSEADSVLS